MAGSRELLGSRELWALVEPVHGVTYFTDAGKGAFARAGLRGFWRGYFAGRAAPLGVTPASVVTALFFGFAPGMVERALPALWESITTEAALQARLAGSVAALRALPGWPDDARALDRAAELARAAVEGAALEGRPLGAANAVLPWPDDPVAVLWQASTTLRELRGDGHVAALLTAGLSGLHSVILRAGLDVDPPVQRAARGWSEQEWSAGVEELQAGGLLTDQARLSEAGARLVHEVETVTSRLAAQPWRALGAERTAEFATTVAPFSAAARSALPAMTPIGRLDPDGP